MNLDDHLESLGLVDCTGRVSHRLTLMIDGTVRVSVGGVHVLIDPRSRSAVPASFNLGRGEYSHQQVIDLACSFANRQ